MENNVIERRAIFAGTTFENKIPPQFLRPKIRFLVESLIRGKPASRLCWGGFNLLHWGWFIASPTHFETNPSVFLRAGGSKVNTYRKTKYNVLPRNKSMCIPHTGGSWTNTHLHQIPPKIPFRRIWPNEEPFKIWLRAMFTWLWTWPAICCCDTWDTIGTLGIPLGHLADQHRNWWYQSDTRDTRGQFWPQWSDVCGITLVLLTEWYTYILHRATWNSCVRRC